MSLQQINAGESGGEVRSKLNQNFEFLEDLIANLSLGAFKGLVDATTISIPTPIEGDWYLVKYYPTYAQTIVPMDNLVINAGELCYAQYTNSAWNKYVITDNIGGGSGGSMTGDEIKAELELLTGSYRLAKSAIRSGEGALNLRGYEDFHSFSSVGTVYKGDFFIHQSGGTISNTYVNGDWVIAKVDNVDESNLTDTTEWLHIPFGKWMAGFSVDINGNVTFEKNVAVKGQAYSLEHKTGTPGNPTDLSAITLDFDLTNVFSYYLSSNVTFVTPVAASKKNGATFMIIITAAANITVNFDATSFPYLSTINLQNTQIVIISGVVSDNRLLCVSSGILGEVSVQNPPVLSGILINGGDAETASSTLTITPTFAGGDDPVEYAIQEGLSGSFGAYEPYTVGDDITYALSIETEGTKTLYVKFRSLILEETSIKSDSILYINEEPIIGGVLINNGATETSSLIVSITLSDVSGLGVKQISLSNDNSNWSAFASYTGAAIQHTLTAGEGNKTVYVKLKNVVGESAVKNASISYEGVAYPDLQSFLINGGSGLETTDRTITITFTLGLGTDPYEYAISENGGVYGDWVALDSSGDTSIIYEVANSNDGVKTIGLKLRDDASTPAESPAKTNTIKIVESVPTIGGLSISNGAATTTTRTVSVTLLNANSSGSVELAIAESEGELTDSDVWVAHTITNDASFILSSGNGIKTIYAQLRNIAGDSTIVSDSITLAEPEVVTLSDFILNGGVTATNQSVLIAFTATGSPDKYRISENNNFSGATWQTITYLNSVCTNTFTLSRGNGTKTVYFQVKRDSDGVTSDPDNYEITMTIAAPTVLITSIVDESSGLMITTSTTNAYEMKVVETASSASPNWADFTPENYDATYYIEPTGIGLRYFHVRVTNYGNLSADTYDTHTIEASYSLANTFKLAVANNTNLISDEFYGFPYTSQTALQIKNTSGNTVSESGNVITLELNLNTNTQTPHKSGTAPGAGLAFEHFPTAAISAGYLYYGSSTTPLKPIQFRLYNLNNDDKYSFRFCHTIAGGTNNWAPLLFSAIGTTTVSGTLNTVIGNTTLEVYLEDISPNNGEILFQVLNEDLSSYPYEGLRGWIIEQYKSE